MNGSRGFLRERVDGFKQRLYDERRLNNWLIGNIHQSDGNGYANNFGFQFLGFRDRFRLDNRQTGGDNFSFGGGRAWFGRLGKKRYARHHDSGEHDENDQQTQTDISCPHRFAPKLRAAKQINASNYTLNSIAHNISQFASLK